MRNAPVMSPILLRRNDYDLPYDTCVLHGYQCRSRASSLANDETTLVIRTRSMSAYIPKRGRADIAATTMSSAVFPPPSLVPLVTQIARILTERKETVCVAETAAGGLISAALLSVPGASAYYSGGLTLYTLASRIAFGGWTEKSLETYRCVLLLLLLRAMCACCGGAVRGC